MRQLLQLLLLAAMAASPLSAKRSGKHHHSGHARGPLNVTAVSGVDVDLRCRVRLQECGNFYSVVWYREQQRLPLTTPSSSSSVGGTSVDADLLPSPPESERVFVYRHNNGRGKAEGPWRGRAEHVYDTKRHVMRVSN